MSRDTREQVRAVTAAGGTYKHSKGHILFYDADNRLIGKSRLAGTKQGRASRSITQAMVDKAAAAAPARMTEPPRARPALVLVPDVELSAPASPLPKEGHQVAEKTILVCDACEADGRVVSAVQSVKMESTRTGQKRKADLCQDHFDELWLIGTVTSGRKKTAPAEEKQPKRTGTHRPPDMRCPLPGDDGYEGVGQGMWQHINHNHPEVQWGDGLKEAAKAAFALAHSNGNRVPAAV